SCGRWRIRICLRLCCRWICKTAMRVFHAAWMASRRCKRVGSKKSGLLRRSAGEGHFFGVCRAEAKGQVVAVGLAGIQPGGRKAGLVGRIGKVLRFEA